MTIRISDIQSEDEIAANFVKLDQFDPQTFTNLGGGTGLMKVTAGLLGLDTNTYALNSALANYLLLAGGTMAGTINSLSIIPTVDSASNLGSSTPKYFANAYLDKVFLNSTATLDGATAGLVNLTGDLDVSGHMTIGDAAGVPSSGSILKLYTNAKDDCYTGVNIAVNNTAFGGEGVTGITLSAQAAFSPKAYTLASSLVTGAKTATLTSVWLRESSTYNVIFSNGDVRVCTFTLDSTTFTWASGLSSNATTAVSVEKVCTGQSGALSGYTIVSGTNVGTSSTYAANAALFYGLYSGTTSRGGSKYRNHYGIDTYGDWGYVALINGYATVGVRAKANANGLWNAFLNYGYTAAFLAADSEDPQETSYIGGTPRQYQHYVAKPTRATNAYQILLAGNGSGTGVFFNGSGAGVDQASVQRIYHDGTNLKVDGNIDFGKVTRSAISYTGGLGATKIDISNSNMFTGTATTNYVVDIQSVSTKTITAISKQTAIVVNIACTGHGLSANQIVELSGMSDSRYDGWYIVTNVPNADTFRVWMDFYGTATGTAQRSTWRWSDDGGSTWDVSNVESCFGYRDLNNGIRVGMLSTVGIAVGNQASWSYTPANYLNVSSTGVDIGDGTNESKFDTAGILTMAGTAKVKRDIWLGADGFNVPGTKPAALVDYGIASAWEFSDGTDDTLYTRVKLPDDMDKSVGMTLSIGWSTPTASAGNCRWQIEYLFRQANEAMDAAADATLVNNFAASGTAKGLTVSAIGTTAVPNSNDVCLTMRIKRRADEAADTLGEDNHLHGICIEYTSNKLGTAT